MGWLEFAAAYAAFFITHSLPVRPPLRPMLQTALGPRGFTVGKFTEALAIAICVVALRERGL